MQRELAQRVKLADFQFSEFCLCLTVRNAFRSAIFFLNV